MRPGGLDARVKVKSMPRGAPLLSFLCLGLGRSKLLQLQTVLFVIKCWVTIVAILTFKLHPAPVQPECSLTARCLDRISFFNPCCGCIASLNLLHTNAVARLHHRFSFDPPSLQFPSSIPRIVANFQLLPSSRSFTTYHSITTATFRFHDSSGRLCLSPYAGLFAILG